MTDRYEYGWTDIRGYFVESTPDKLVRRVLLDGRMTLARSERKVYVERIHDADLRLARGGSMMAMLADHVLGDNDTYRVSVFPDGVDVMSFGLEGVDPQIEGHYDSIDLLPNWVKERLAVLSMIPPTPPTTLVVGVGRRISAHVYWVCAPRAHADASTSA